MFANEGVIEKHLQEVAPPPDQYPVEIQISETITLFLIGRDT